ncbi:MAG: asparaginase [Betaproteobacteria bacterium]|nr:MAG: asparaginase [Betaproteobacteria bacterium]
MRVQNHPVPSSPLSAAPPHVPLARVTRGNAVDSVHYGSVAVVDAEGRLKFAAGDPHYLTTTRSALKPLQALPLAAGGGIERFGYSLPQVALLCASHSGEPRHVEAVEDMLGRAGCTREQLQCGVHPPLYYTAHEELPPYGVKFNALHHNCSGKHTGMLAYCRMCSLPVDSYLTYEHPLQQAIRQAVSHMTGVPESQLVAGIDGCSAPNYAVPLDRLAYAYARMVTDRGDVRYASAPAKLAAAMTAHPEMVSGEKRNDLILMRAGRGDWTTKVGAEGVQAIGVRSKRWGIAVKVVDGNARGLHPATVAVLDQLGLLDEAQRTELCAWGAPAIRNYRGIVTGRIEPVLVLEEHV